MRSSRDTADYAFRIRAGWNANFYTSSIILSLSNSLLVLEHILSVAYCYAKHSFERPDVTPNGSKFLNKKFLIALLSWLSLSLVVTSGQTLNLPPRPYDAPTGSQFVYVISRMPLTERENWIFAQVMSGNVPNFLRSLVPITVNGTINGIPHSATYYVSPDYLAIGTDTDYFLEPMTPLLAQRLCDALGCTLPTRKMVNQIWTNAAVKLNPQPIPPSAEMITVPVFADHNFMVRTQRDGFTNAFPLGGLVSGDKKDVIISSKIYTNFANTNITKPVVIYGWQYATGSPIQPLYNGHEETYADYSHGVRLVQNALLLDGNPNPITNILTDANLAGLLSDEGASEATSAGVIRVPHYTILAVAPVILIHPRNRTVLAGASLAFHTLVAGDAPLRYRWYLNGATINGETNATLLLSNAQPANAGNYSVVVTNNSGATTSRVAWLRINTNPHPVVFADAFEADSSSSWNIYWGSANGISDYTVDWAYDYSFTSYTFNGATTVIPPAPNSADDNTRGVRLTVNNNDAIGAIAGVNLYPKSQSFTGNFALKFDLWINYPGGVGGINSTGSTEHAIFGIDHMGTQVNWAAPSGSASDGVWYGVDGEGGTSRDYRAYVGNPSGPPNELIGMVASGLSESNNSAPFYQTLFPSTRFETAGSPGKQWVEVELRQTNNIVTWLMDGIVIAQRANASPFTSGNVMLGFMDTFASIANPAEEAFVLFDNVRVEDLDNRIRFLSAALDQSGRPQFSFSAAPGQSYDIQGSTNLVDWQTISTVTASNAPIFFIEPQLANYSRRFYRVTTR
jgi:hypothetical protein